MSVCKYQHALGRAFLHEHPKGAQSWSLACVEEVEALDGVQCTSFHQCCYGLVAPFTGKPMRKPTTFLHNIAAIDYHLRNSICQCQEEHQPIQSTICGVKISAHAQVYPPALCDAILQCLRTR